MSQKAVEITQMQDPVFGKLIKLSNGQIELMATLDFGPRIIHFSRVGMENMLYQDLDKKPLGEKLDVYNGDIMRLYGGHRLWVSPEVMPSCYYPDNVPVACETLPGGNGIVLTEPVEIYNHIQKSIAIEMAPDRPEVTIRHSIRNCGPWDIEIAPWAITMLATGGIEIMPQSARETGYLHNRNFSFWDYSAMNDSRLYLGKDYLTLKQDADMAHPFKLGYNNENGWAAYINKGQIFIKFIEPEIDGFYPDGGCCFETYTCEFMLEMETLGQMAIIPPGQSVEHTEEWELYPEEQTPGARDEAAIKAVIGRYVR